MKFVALAVAACAIAVAAPAARAQDADAGEKIFARCKACHDIEGKNKVGPTLKGVVGRKAGTVEGFKYSDAMLKSGLTWDEATLREYITDPKAKVPGNKMAFAGVKKPEELDPLIAYLLAHGK